MLGALRTELHRSEHSCLRNIQKLEALLKEVDNLYEELADMKAEARTSGFSEKRLNCTYCGF